MSVFFFLVTFRAVRHYILNFLAKKEAVRNCMLRPRQGNWRLKCAAVQDRALKLYPAKRNRLVAKRNNICGNINSWLG